MIAYVKAMLDDFPIKLKDDDTAPTPAPDNLFAPSEGEDLDKSKAEAYHTFTAKGLCACKRARPDTQPTIAGLCTRVKKPTTGDWDKLVRHMRYLNGTRNDKLILSADDIHVIKWYVDAAFAVHPDFKSHSGGVMSVSYTHLTLPTIYSV